MAEKASTRYQPGSYKAPDSQDVEIEGVGSFLVRPLSNREQDTVKKDNPKRDGQSDDDHSEELGYAQLSACLAEPKLSAKQIREEMQDWTVRQGTEFARKVLQAAEVLDEEDLGDVRRRFRPQDD